MDGHQRQFPVRIGLAKEDSIYFVVLLLTPRPQQFSHPSPSPHGREWPYAAPQQSPYAQLTPVSASFGPVRPRLGESPRDSGFTPRQAGTPGPIMPVPSPGVSPNMHSYAASSTMIRDHATGASYIPRSELPGNRAPQPGYQLPPIRNPPQAGPSGPGVGWPREERGSRVDIGGLIDKPETSRGGP